MKLLQEFQVNGVLIGIILPKTADKNMFNGRTLMLSLFVGLYSISTPLVPPVL